jgi:hypothetical protein
MSSVYPDSSPAAVAALRDTVLRNADQWPGRVRWVRHLPGFLLRPLLDFVIRRALVTESVECPLRTVSEVIREQQVPHIDLLKVDVEKAELDVLEGVEAGDWPRIRQVVVEVHDLDGRLARVTDLLRANGFGTIAVDQEAFFRGSEIFNVYARREGVEVLLTPGVRRKELVS